MAAAPIAVIGMSFRFPGADTPAQYWRDIRDGVSHVRRFTDEEFAAAGIPESQYGAPGYVGASAPLSGVDRFDAAFFGMSGREAAVTDPQQRLFLQCCHHALEDGGYAGRDEETRIGVYASSGYRLYSLHSYLANNLAAQAGSDDWVEVKGVQVGNYPDFTANRAAFRLGLTGPVLNVATACSSSLVSVHLACQALRAGEADLMIAGSAALHLPQVTGHVHVKGSTISPTGTVRAFDAEADGTVGGNGVAAVVLKRLDEALADGDTVHAVIRGSAVTNDGAAKRGFAAPSVSGQQDAVLRALADADVSADSIGHLEAHGTGTLKGDPIEFAALRGAFRAHTDRTGFCSLGSTKPAIGHLDSCAGLAGFVKAVLVLRHATIPPLVNFNRPNPALDLETSPFTVPTAARTWPRGDTPRRAGVHSIGMGGTNAHVILEEAPARPGPFPDQSSPPALLTLSAHDRDALRDGARLLRDRLRAPQPPAPRDLITTLALGRPALPHRLVVTADPADPEAQAAALDGFLAGTDAGAGAGAGVSPTPAPHCATGIAPAPTSEGHAPPPVAFLFSGQGTPYAGMGRPLADRHPAVRETLDACLDLHRQAGGGPALADALFGIQGPWRWGTALAQPALFALQAAQLRLWESLGVRPAAVAGHSVGEYAALHAAGALSLADGMRLLTLRGRLMQEKVRPGRMLAVFASRDLCTEIAAQSGEVELALVNGPAHHVLAGPPEAIEEAARRCAKEGLDAHPVPVDRAFHSALLEPVLDEFRAAAEQVVFQPVCEGFVSGLDGATHPAGWLPDAAFLVRQAREPVEFHEVLRTLGATRPGALVELGPTASLTGMARRALPATPAVPTQERKDAPGRPRALWNAAAALHCRGAELTWRVLLEGAAGRRVPLPGYAFRPTPHWLGPPPLDTPAPQDRPTNSPTDAENTMTQESAAQVLERVVELTARHLGYPPEELDVDTTFVGLGADSLQLIGLIRQLEAEFDAEIALHELLEDAGTLRLAARMLASRSEAGAEAVADGASGEAPQQSAPEASPAPFQAQAQAQPQDRSPEVAPQDHAPEFATRAEVDELVRHIGVVAETQSRMLTQLSDVLALLTADRGSVIR
ncbi:type I polyketide synthase [Streptomyces sp. NPDC051561]|uniref:type I polyketide synthase n=1 Tax=Streptomyces sp. NPDC051561 TaxID=3365658 RepID=UPI0037B936DC